jgi:hypothetical protein
MFWNF